MSGLVVLNHALRVDDHQALASALAHHERVFLCYIDDKKVFVRPRGKAQQGWLGLSIAKFPHPLLYRSGDFLPELEKIITQNKVSHVYYTAQTGQSCNQAEALFSGLKVPFKIYTQGLLVDPKGLKNKTGGSYRVFTPFYNAALLTTPRAPLPIDKALLDKIAEPVGKSSSLPTATSQLEFWEPGELGAKKQLAHALKISQGYDRTRDIPGIRGTTRLSPHVALGEISPHQIYHQLSRYSGAAPLIRQLYWREFSYYILHYFPKFSSENFNPKFNTHPWRNLSNPGTQKLFDLWCQGKTGYNLIDAGMRELSATGWMHNRVRMLVASFLTKNLHIHWKFGEKYFWETLLDADCANNPMGWQWVAGCGVDASPYYRIFNPETQQKKFDPDYSYIKKWVPDYASTRIKITDLSKSRAEALAYYKSRIN